MVHPETILLPGLDGTGELFAQSIDRVKQTVASLSRPCSARRIRLR